MFGLLDRLFKRRPLRHVVVEAEVIDDLLGAAKSCYPREFGALLEGTLQGDTVRIDGYILPRTLFGRNSVLMNIGLLPSTTQTVGSIHSHPTESALPSAADLELFGKRGFVHFIVARPYSRSDVRAYDRSGREIAFVVE